MRPDDPNLPQLRRIAEALGELREQVVFVGGAVAGLLVTDPLADSVRATRDVDAVVNASRATFHRIEKQVAQRTIELDRVWRNSRDILLVLDEAGIIRAVNPAWNVILGQTAGAVVSHALTTFIWNDDRADVEAMLRNVAATEGSPWFCFENKARSLLAV